MANLDDLRQIERLDKDQMGRTIDEFPDQLASAYENLRGVTVPAHYVQARNIVILGLDASALAPELAASFALPTANIPIEVWRDYDLPGYVNKDTIVIGVSYSGTTEETVSGFAQAASRGAKLVAITAGGELASLARKFQAPLFSIDYGAQGRAAFGYLFTACIVLLAKLRYLSLGERELQETAILLQALAGKLRADVPTTGNLAKQLAGKIKDKIPLMIGAGPMAIVGRRWKSQFNQNGKLVAVYESVPELCHNLLVSMDKVYRQREYLYPLFLQSAFSHSRNQLRMSIVNRQFSGYRLSVETIFMHPSGTPISEALQMILLGDYISYYLALQASIDPTDLPATRQFKKELEQHPWTS